MMSERLDLTLQAMNLFMGGLPVSRASPFAFSWSLTGLLTIAVTDLIIASGSKPSLASLLLSPASLARLLTLFARFVHFL